MQFRLAELKDLTMIMDLIYEAKQHLKQQGIDQWQDDYPNLACIEHDINTKSGYVLEDQQKIISYACISFDGEDAYETLVGSWLSHQPYAVIHRLVISDQYKGQGLCSQFLNFAQSLCQNHQIHSIKVDTDLNNQAMKHILIKNGFHYCGIIQFDGSDKIAFEKIF